MYYIEVEKNVKVLVQDLNPCGKKTVFLVHGWPVSHKMFEYQLNVLPKYGFRCIAMDLRGFGGSDKPWDGYSYDRLSDDLYAVIKSLDVDNLILAGFSMGGPIVIRYMARHAGYRVSKLALISAAAPSFTRRPGYPYGMTKEEVNGLIMKAYKNRPQMVSDFGDMFFASRVTRPFVDWFQSIQMEASGHATIKTAESLRDEDVGPDLSGIRVPTGIFHGMQDRVCPFPFALILNANIKGSQLYSFNCAGHGLFYDELEKFNCLFLQFLMGDISQQFVENASENVSENASKSTSQK